MTNKFINDTLDITNFSISEFVEKFPKFTPVIYGILHVTTGKWYVGQTNRLCYRIFDHFHGFNHSNKHFQDVLTKDGIRAFRVYLLQVIEESQDIVQIEDNWIIKLNSLYPNGFNIKLNIKESYSKTPGYFDHCQASPILEILTGRMFNSISHCSEVLDIPASAIKSPHNEYFKKVSKGDYEQYIDNGGIIYAVPYSRNSRLTAVRNTSPHYSILLDGREVSRFEAYASISAQDYYDERKMFYDVEEFHAKFELDKLFSDSPSFSIDEIIQLKIKHLFEELVEFAESCGYTLKDGIFIKDAKIVPDLENALDALIDLTYVLFGTVLYMGLREQFIEGWKRVHSSNMTKTKALKPEDSKRGSAFDIIKGPDFIPASLKDLLTIKD